MQRPGREFGNLTIYAPDITRFVCRRVATNMNDR